MPFLSARAVACALAALFLAAVWQDLPASARWLDWLHTGRALPRTALLNAGVLDVVNALMAADSVHRAPWLAANWNKACVASCARRHCAR